MFPDVQINSHPGDGFHTWKTIDVEGLPELVAQALHEIVRAIREQMHEPQEARKPEERRVQLRTWSGTVIGPLTREEIHDAAGRI